MRATARGHCTHAQQETATWPFQTIPLSSNVKMKKKKKKIRFYQVHESVVFRIYGAQYYGVGTHNWATTISQGQPVLTCALIAVHEGGGPARTESRVVRVWVKVTGETATGSGPFPRFQLSVSSNASAFLRCICSSPSSFPPVDCVTLLLRT